MELGLEGKVALVTGGARGIGAAISLELAHQGCSLAIVDISPLEIGEVLAGQIVEQGGKSIVLQSDVSDFTEAEKCVESVQSELGGLDIVVCNAGINRDGVIWKMTEEVWDEVLNINLKGCFNFCRASAKVFRQQGNGKIVNVASINGLRGKFGQSNYSASKGGIIALTKSVAAELGRYDVNVNAIAPGMVMTDMATSLPKEILDQAVEETVLGRVAEPEEIAHLVAFLCSDYARHITGEVIKIDGGQYI